MKADESIWISGLLRFVVRDPAVRESLLVRPDWVNHLYRRLVELRDPFPSDVPFSVWWPGGPVLTAEEIPIVPRLGLIATTPLKLGETEIYFKDGAPMRFADSEPVPMTSSDFTPRGIALTVPYPIQPGHLAFTVLVPPDASAADWHDVLALAWKQITTVRKAQARVAREQAISSTQQALEEMKEKLRNSEPDPQLAEFAELLRLRLEELQSKPRRPRVRIDRPFRELAWLRDFLGGRMAPAAISDAWDERVRRWRRHESDYVAADPLLTAAHDEWRLHPTTSEPSTDTTTVDRSLRRWIGDVLGPNPEVHPDPLAPGGYRWSGKVARGR